MYPTAYFQIVLMPLAKLGKNYFVMKEYAVIGMVPPKDLSKASY
jgi:hypothetical protein